VAGVEDSVRSNRVFRESARSWAKRTIIQNAIRELKPELDISIAPAPDPPVVPPRDHGRHFQLNRVFALEDLERFLFVMSVLERYSDHECSLMLASSPRANRRSHNILDGNGKCRTQRQLHNY
jgi:hypothetical protein